MQHTHIAAYMFGPPHITQPSGAPLPGGQAAPYQEIILGPVGSVSFRRNAPQATGGINTLPVPYAGGTVPITKAW